ncbi:PH domain-containing protein [Altererythrobacter xixiisoli]|uniref:PH domain-containing protein n=1 Tax=Croceibacterium xixiisoli TaxID=1476466 RepID=A0A6I4TVS9_9SPHN|nr:PH domain-containing protein [Croceibacterium xixiisoli]MXP00085.1 PH domain-containing protein [Croceibacterium xixiisoli]
MSQSEAPPADWRRASPLGILVYGLQSAGSLIVPVLIALMARQGDGMLALLAMPVVIAVLSAPFAVLRWLRYRYWIDDESVMVQQGVLSRKLRSVPRDRIEDVRIEQALLPRLIGLAAVRIETGGGGADEIAITYVRLADAEALRARLRAYATRVHAQAGRAPAQAGRGQGVVDPPLSAQDDEGQLLFAMNPGRVMLSGLFEFSLFFFVALLALITQFRDLLPFDPWDWMFWRDLLAGQAGWLTGLGVVSQVLVILALLSGLVVLGLMAGVIMMVLRNWGFRLDQTPRGLRYRRGLLKRVDVVTPLHQIQAAAVSTGAIRRLFGWHSLTLITQSSESQLDEQLAVPFGRMAEIAHVMAAVGYSLPNDEMAWKQCDPRYPRDQAALSMVRVLLIGGLLLAVPALLKLLAGGLGLTARWQDVQADWYGLIEWTPPVLAVLLLMRAIPRIADTLMMHRTNLHFLGNQQLVVRTGWLAPGFTLMSRTRLHAMSVAQTALARHRCYANLLLDGAGTATGIMGMPKNGAWDLRAELLPDVLAHDFASLARKTRPIQN